MRIFLFLLFTLSLLLLSCKDNPSPNEVSQEIVKTEAVTEAVNINSNQGIDSNQLIEVGHSWEVVEDDFAFKVTQIDSLAYYNARPKSGDSNAPVRKITDYPTAKKMLSGIVDFDETYYKTSDTPNAVGFYKMYYRNGIENNSPMDDVYFQAYFPDEDIILFKTDNHIDISFNLTTGTTTEYTGNPSLNFTSANQQTRLIGYHNSDDCLAYAVQLKTADSYAMVLPLSDVFSEDNTHFLCQIEAAFWAQDATIFIKSRPDFYGPPTYYKVTIINTIYPPDLEDQKLFISQLRPSQKLEPGKVYTDTVTFVKVDTDYDHVGFGVRKDQKMVYLIYNDNHNFKRGDELEIEWKIDQFIEAGSQEVFKSEYLVAAKKINDGFISALEKGLTLSSFFSDNWILEYYHDNRCDGITLGKKEQLSSAQIDANITLQVTNDGKGWNCEEKPAATFDYRFSLKEEVKDWDRFEVDIYEDQENNIFYLEGAGESDYLKLYFDANNLIIKLEYRSEDPG